MTYVTPQSIADQLSRYFVDWSTTFKESPDEPGIPKTASLVFEGRLNRDLVGKDAGTVHTIILGLEKIDGFAITNASIRYSDGFKRDSVFTASFFFAGATS